MALADHKPFVLVPVPDPDADVMVTGHVLDLDGHNRACGWYENADGDRLAFYFDGNASTLGATTILPLPSGAAHAEARGMWETQPPNYPRLVGVAYNSTMTRAEAVTWEYESSSGAWTVSYVFNTSQNHDSVANAVSKGCDCDPNASCDPLIAGHRDGQGTSGSDTLAYRRLWTAGTVDYFDVLSSESWGADINACGIEVGRLDPGSGSEQAYWWVPANDDYDVIHPSGYDASAALAINSVVEDANDGPDIVGWVEDDGDVSAALWRNKNNFMQLVIFATTPGQDFFARDINNQSEIVVSASEVEDEFNSGAWIYKDVTGATTYSLSGLVQFPAAFPVPTAPARMHRATSIANNLHIGGSYVPGDGSAPMPCLLIPHNVDNDYTLDANGHPILSAPRPDFREIVNGQEDDTNGNWIPDAFEGMRPGLYAVGLSPQGQLADEVANMHAIRLHLDYDADTSIDDIVNDDAAQKKTCTRFQLAVEVYGETGGATGEKKEIIAMIRSQDTTDSGRDVLPSNPSAWLSDLALFAERYARCIDYIQFGNEFFSGPGQYYLDSGDLGCSGWSGGYLKDITTRACLEEACEEIMGWMCDQVNTARYASALEGRPLRFISPATNHGTVIQGSGGNRNASDPMTAADRAALAMDCLVRFANHAGAAVDLHCHYEAISDVIGTSSGPYLLLNPNTTNHWPVPDMVTSLEWSPKAVTDGQGDWAFDNRDEIVKYFPPTPQNPNPLVFTDWDDMIADWEDKQFPTAGFQFADVLDEFACKGFLHACYGGYKQGNVGFDDGGTPTNCSDDLAEPDHWVLPVIRAEQVKCYDNWTSGSCWAQSCWIDDSTDKFTALKGVLETAASSYSTALENNGFNPHPTACDCHCVNNGCEDQVAD